ncbi:MAG: hypothetical protein DME91_09630 [Verrucomicrobia bacterium]|nr:MAG: hypothetical protein DME91_09630 [Verrucomicrobiota bacterium]
MPGKTAVDPFFGDELCQQPSQPTCRSTDLIEEKALQWLFGKGTDVDPFWTQTGTVEASAALAS